jgi:hypothetical protein
MPDATVPIPAGPLQLSITLQPISAVKVEPGHWYSAVDMSKMGRSGASLALQR